MIPKVIKLINDEPKENTIQHTSECPSKCQTCNNIITPTSSSVVLTDLENEYIVCDLCIGNNMYFVGKVIFKDRWEMYVKRLKNGWIKNLLKENADAKNKASS